MQRVVYRLIMLEDSQLQRVHLQRVHINGVDVHAVLALLVLWEAQTRHLRPHKREDEEQYEDERIFSHGCKGTKKSEELRVKSEEFIADLTFLTCYSNFLAHKRHFSTPSRPNFSSDWAVSKTVRTWSGLDLESNLSA